MAHSGFNSHLLGSQVWERGREKVEDVLSNKRFISRVGRNAFGGSIPQGGLDDFWPHDGEEVMEDTSMLLEPWLVKGVSHD
jgi:hypothetical protein